MVSLLSTHTIDQTDLSSLSQTFTSPLTSSLPTKTKTTTRSSPPNRILPTPTETLTNPTSSPPPPADFLQLPPSQTRFLPPPTPVNTSQPPFPPSNYPTFTPERLSETRMKGTGMS
jgi:hypothetical protein